MSPSTWQSIPTGYYINGQQGLTATDKQGGAVFADPSEPRPRGDIQTCGGGLNGVRSDSLSSFSDGMAESGPQAAAQWKIFRHQLRLSFCACMLRWRSTGGMRLRTHPGRGGLSLKPQLTPRLLGS